MSMIYPEKKIIY